MVIETNYVNGRNKAMSQYKKTILIVPVAVPTHLTPEFEHSGVRLNCVNAISTIDLEEFDEIVYAIDSWVDNYFHISERINLDLTHMIEDMLLASKSPKIKYKLIDSSNGMADTVRQVLKDYNNGLGSLSNLQVFIKDGDNVSYNGKDRYYPTKYQFNTLITGSLECEELVDPIHKSYVTTDDQGFVTNIIEKRVISDKFVAGGYWFNNAELLYKGYEELKDYTDTVYISDIIYWMILNYGERFQLEHTDAGFVDFNLDKYGINSIEHIQERNNGR